jgi:hypothetical protein
MPRLIGPAGQLCAADFGAKDTNMTLSRNLLTAAALAACISTCLPPLPALAEPFTLAIHEAPAEFAKRADKGEAGMAYWKAYADFGKQAGEAGILRGGAALDSLNGGLSLTDAGTNPFDVGTGLVFGGYFQIDVTNVDAAKEWALKIPAARTGRIDILPNVPGPAM